VAEGEGASIRTFIAEDEPPARATMRQLLQADPEVEVVGEAWGAAVVDGVRATRPDLLLLDVRMPGMDGFEILRKLGPDVTPVIVFVTAYDEYAVEAFEVRAIDYLLKPYTDERFQEALARAKIRLRRGERDAPRLEGLGSRPGDPGLRADEAGLPGLRGERLMLREGGRLVSIPHPAITWIEASGVYVQIHTAEGRTHLVRCAMKELARLLGLRGFHRVHRSAIVNLDRVREVRPLTHGDGLLILVDGTRVKLSRSRRDGFERAFLGQAGSEAEGP
jgi:two-component system LytT family response regulator